MKSQDPGKLDVVAGTCYPRLLLHHGRQRQENPTEAQGPYSSLHSCEQVAQLPGWRDSSVVQSQYCSGSGPEFHSWNPHEVTHNYLQHQLQRDLIPPSGSCGHCIHVHTQIKIKIHSSKKRRPCLNVLVKGQHPRYSLTFTMYVHVCAYIEECAEMTERDNTHGERRHREL